MSTSLLSAYQRGGGDLQLDNWTLAVWSRSSIIRDTETSDEKLNGTGGITHLEKYNLRQSSSRLI